VLENVSLAFGTLFPEVELYFYGIVPVKAKWLALIWGGIMGFQFVTNDLLFKLFLLIVMAPYLIFFSPLLYRNVRHRMIVARNRRLFAVPAMLEAFLAKLAERRGEITAEVTVAQPLNEARTMALNEQLRRAAGARVAVDIRADPVLLGGMTVKVGSRMVDGVAKKVADQFFSNFAEAVSPSAPAI